MKLKPNSITEAVAKLHRFRKKCVLASRRLEIGIDEFPISDPKLNNRINRSVGGKWNSLTLCFDLAFGKYFIY